MEQQQIGPQLMTTNMKPIPEGQKRPVQTRVAVYDARTGEMVMRHMVDAREMVARGGWAFEPPKTKRSARGEKAD